MRLRSSYEPNISEAFAESVRLFILNPDLLLQGSFKRFSFIASTLGLKPVHHTPWRTILQFAHPKLIEAAERWAERDGCLCGARHGHELLQTLEGFYTNKARRTLVP